MKWQVSAGLAAGTGAGLGLWWYGLAPPPRLHSRAFEASLVVLKHHQCDLMDLPKVLDDLQTENRGRLDPAETRMVGVYFDNPLDLADRTQARCAVGYFLDSEAQKSAFEHFRGLEPAPGGYHLRQLPRFHGVAADLPFRNRLSFAALMPVYVAASRQARAAGNDRGVGLEYYDFRDPANRRLGVVFPTDQLDTFQFSPYPEPPRRKA